MIMRETTRTRARKRATKTVFMLSSMALVLSLLLLGQTQAFVPRQQRISTRRSFVPQPIRHSSVIVVQASTADDDTQQQQWYTSSPSQDYSEQEKIRRTMNDNKNNNNNNVNSQGHQKDDPEWKFFDTARMHAAGGDGGTGCVAFRREKGEPRGGPSGGSGGRGGSIYLVCDEGLNTLAPIRNRVHVRAKKGKNGLGKSKHGIKGHHILVRVPKGTVVRDLKTNKLAGELREHGESLLVAKGGRGGRGNKAFMTHRFTSPKLAERGEPGVQRWLAVELRLVADVGFLGKPNAGKSTLLASASAARPKIADYPFTTVVPNLGVCDIGDEGAGLVLCDIPGLIEGAAGGAGLGPAFLRHVQRCKVLLHVIDATAEDPIGDFHTINKELAEYDEVLAKKEQVVILNKNDCIDAEQEAELLKQLREAAGHTRVLSISAVTKDGVKELMGRLKKFVSAQPEAELPPPPEIDLSKAGLDYDSDDFEIESDPSYPGQWRVTGAYIEQVAQMTHWEYPQALERFGRQLDALGISAELQARGAQDGDLVMIDKFDFDFAPGMTNIYIPPELLEDEFGTSDEDEEEERPWRPYAKGGFLDEDMGELIGFGESGDWDLLEDDFDEEEEFVFSDDEIWTS